MSSKIDIEQLRSRNGQAVGTSRWFDVSQELINEFAHATHDPDPQHIDPEWARAHGPFEGTIAFGFWTASLLSAMAHDIGYYADLMDRADGAYPLNYGFDRLRLITPVPVGGRVRDHMVQKDVEDRGDGKILVRTDNTVEIEGHDRPALIAEWLFMIITPA